MEPRVVMAALLVLTGCASAAGGNASSMSPPSEDERQAIAVVNTLFDGMRARDTLVIRSTLHPAARLLTAAGPSAERNVREMPIDAWLRSVASADVELDERLHATEARVSGPLATVWTEYDFWLGERFSHCGVDAFQLARTADGWKIIQITDTRQTQGCVRAPAQ